MVIQSKKIRNAAKGEACTLNVAGVCNYSEDTVVFAHFPSEIAGYKSTDLSGGFACSNCHDWIDRRVFDDDQEREFYMRRSQVRTFTRLIELGIVSVKGVA